jgi:glycosyltransferase involved in cell wall biosynthesis
MESLSVVIITRNEEDYIARCVSSVLDAAAQIGGAEIVMVDSASTDPTVEIARSFGIRVLSIRSNRNLSAAAGRFVGFHNTYGSLVMFVDGDTVLDRDFFRMALPYFDQAAVAGLMGYLNDFDTHGREMPYVGFRSTQVVTSPWLRGIAMYRRSAMDGAGTFNPYLMVEEEAELALRLRRRGLVVLNVPHQMGNHLRGRPDSGLLRVRQDYRLFTSVGRTLRYAVNAGNGMQFIFARNSPTVRFAATALVLLAGITFGLLGHPVVAKTVMVALVLGSAAVAIKTRTLIGPMRYFARHTLILYGFVVGSLITTVEDPSDYPVEVFEAAPDPSITNPLRFRRA